MFSNHSVSWCVQRVVVAVYALGASSVCTCISPLFTRNVVRGSLIGRDVDGGVEANDRLFAFHGVPAGRVDQVRFAQVGAGQLRAFKVRPRSPAPRSFAPRSGPSPPEELRVESLGYVTGLESAGALVQVELVASVGDVEVAHRQLANAVKRTERLIFDPLHGETFRLVGQVV